MSESTTPRDGVATIAFHRSVAAKLGAVAIAILVLAVTSILTSATALRSARNQVRWANAAGGLRVVGLRVVAIGRVLREATGEPRAAAPREMLDCAEEMDRKLVHLLDGDPDNHVPPLEGEAARGQLGALAREWSEQIGPFIRRAAKGATASTVDLDVRIPAWVVKMDDLLGQYEAEATGTLSRQTRLAYLTAALFLALFAGLVLIARKSLEHERASLRLRRRSAQSEKQYRAVLDNHIDGVALTVEGKISYANPTLCEMSGYSLEELIGRPAEFVIPEERNHADRRTDRLRRGETQDPRAEYRLVRKDGDEVPVEVQTRPIEYSGGPALLSVLRDITARLKARDDLRERDAQLRQAVKMEAVGRLAGGVAHDFNNMLTAVLGFSSSAMSHDLPEEVRDDLGEIRRAAQRASVLTRQLLGFSRKQVIHPRVLDLNAVLTEAAKMLRRVIGEDIQLTLDLDPDLGAVRADPGQIEQVLLNLAVNARDAMADGGELTIETANAVMDEAFARDHAGAKLGPYVRFSMTDTGTGMDATTLAHIFEPFFTTKSSGEGTGLGLSMVYGVVKQNDGYIAVDSTPGEGSTFQVFLPRDASENNEEAAVPVVPTYEGPLRIVLVEDDDTVRKLAVATLERAGHAVLSAADGEEALRVWAGRDGPVDVLVTDVVMPKMNGRELAQRFRKDEPNLGVLFVSGYSSDIITDSGALESGAELLDKPFLPEVLSRKVAEIAAAHRGID